MEFRLLGPLEILDRGRALPVRGPKQRALLAFLLLNANEVVPDDRLLDELWPEGAPGSGGAAVRVRVSQLRKALGDGVSLEARAPGYVLAVEPERIDVRRFERLVQEGRTGDAEHAAAALREALALWRGPALADFAYDAFAQAEIARLEELRLGALEARIEADLALGRHTDLVGELDALVAEHPLRERLRGQLMLALYRAGRQAEALETYRNGRRLLVEELGIEPTPELQRLEQAILRQDPALELEPPRRPAPVPAEERKLVTVLAADLAHPVERDPERARDALDRYRAAMAAEIEEAGGRMETFVGGALTAAFGVPVAQEDHVERALHTALSMRRRAEELFGDALALRIGIETGEVVVGRATAGGSSFAGSAVTAAARLERAADPGAILVGDRMVASARSAFEFGPPARGAAGRPLVRSLSVTRPRATAPALVGRRRELDQLWTAYRGAVADGRPHLVTVTGDAGVGKTRLVLELWERLGAEQPEPLRRTGRCLPYGRGITYRPLGDVLREELGLLETDAPDAIRRRLGDREILGLTLGLDVAPELHPLVARERLYDAWVAFFAELAARQPVVVLVEDLHWAQEPLLDLLERLLDEVAGPLLLVATARPELHASRPSWGRRLDAAAIWVEPLPPELAEQMLDSLGEHVPDGLRRLVLDRAEGNPFFLEELAQAIPFAREMPDSVQAVLASRIDLLPPTEKEALQAAAVIGRVFWRGPVRELLGGVAPDFAVLEARDFVRRRRASALAGEPEFAFKHALTRDVAYASVPKARRGRLHAGFAAWLEDAGGGRDEHAAFLAHHYAEAVRPDDADLAWKGQEAELGRLRERAVAWLRRAAELAIGRYELEEALELLHRALELGPELELWRLVGRANALRHDGERFLDAMTRAIELSPDRETAAELYAELSFESSLRAGMWRRRPDRELVDGWIDRALELAAPGSPARARALIARSVWAPAGSADAAREASEIAERVGEDELRSYAWDARGITMWVEGHPDLGRAWEERRFELVDRIRDPDHVADIHYAPVTGCVWLGYFDEARRLARRHDEITSGLTPHHRIHGIAVLLEVEELAGGWEAVRTLEERAENTILGNLETPCVRSPRSLLLCALAALESGDAARAAALEERAEEFGMEGYGHVLDTPRIKLALARGDLERVERLLAEPLPDRGWHRAWLLLSTQAARLDALAALGRREELEAWPQPRRGTYLEPFLLRALGIVREDETQLARALERFEASGLRWHAEQTRMLLGPGLDAGGVDGEDAP